MAFFRSKRILFISPSFFSYEKEIVKKMTAMGAEVVFYDDRPSNSVFIRGVIRVYKSILRKKIKQYYQKIEREISSKEFDFLFIIKGEAIDINFLSRFKANNSNCKIILYQYDSIKNNKNAIDCFPFIDKVYTFDLNDIAAYPFMKFRPLFYVDDYKALKAGAEDLIFTFIGTAHSDRYHFVKSVVAAIPAQKAKSFLFFYCQSKVLFYFRRLFDASFKNVPIKDISFAPLSKAEVLKIIERSRIIIDIQHPNQTGLTMRTIESLGAGKKLITTNENIKKYDFYNPSNVLVVDRKDPAIIPQFLDAPYEELSISIYQKYSLENWLLEIFTTE